MNIELEFIVFKVRSMESHFHSVAVDMQYTYVTTSLCPERPLYRPIIDALRVTFLHKESLLRVPSLRYSLHAPATLGVPLTFFRGA